MGVVGGGRGGGFGWVGWSDGGWGEAMGGGRAGGRWSCRVCGGRGRVGLLQRQRPALLSALSRENTSGSWTPRVVAKGVLVSSGPTKSKASCRAWLGAADGGATPCPPHLAPGFSPPPRHLSRQAHAAMLVDVIHLWADRAPVNYTAPGAYGVLDQYLGGIRAMVGPEGRGQGRMGAQESAGRPRRSRRPPAPPCSPPCRSRRYKISRPCSRPRRGGEATRAS